MTDPMFAVTRQTNHLYSVVCKGIEYFAVLNTDDRRWDLCREVKNGIPLHMFDAKDLAGLFEYLWIVHYKAANIVDAIDRQEKGK